jgi:hypothetical protein
MNQPETPPSARPSVPPPLQDPVGLVIVGSAMLLIGLLAPLAMGQGERPSPRAAIAAEYPELLPLLDGNVDPAVASRFSTPLLNGIEYLHGVLLLVGIGILVLLVWTIGRRAEDRRGLPLGEPFHDRPWALWGAGQALALALLVPVVTAVVARQIAAATGADAAEAGRYQAPAFGFAGAFAGQLATVVAVVLLLRVRYGATWQDLGLKTKGLGRALIVGALAFAAFLPVQALLGLLTRWLMDQLDVPVDQHEIIAAYLLTPDQWVRTVLVLVALVGAPLSEEFLLRGTLQPGLRRRFGPWAAILLTALLFTALHGNMVDWPLLFVLALLLGWVYEHTNNIAAPITLHLFNNALTMLTVVGLSRAVG